MSLGRFEPTTKSRLQDRDVIIVRVDPAVYALKLLCASEHGGRLRTIKQWAEEFDLKAAINAGMYQASDFSKSTGYMQNYGHVNNPYINPGYGAFMVFNAKQPHLPDVQMVDRLLQENWMSLIGKYHSVVQNYRMISSGEKRGWPQQAQVSSVAAIGMDRNNHVLFILSRSSCSIHDFIHVLLGLPIQIDSAMYVEGGPQASLILRTQKAAGMWIGDCQGESYHMAPGCQIPNVIGVVKRPN
ncbi:MAG: phosphodiester glycosidase family protein [Deltaproteobacteria bacterium]